MHKKGGGVLVLASQCINAEIIPLNTTLKEIEMVCIQIKIDNMSPFRVIGVYSPPQCQFVQYIELCNAFSFFFQNNSIPTVILGDLNLPDVNWNEGVAPSIHFQDDILGMLSVHGLEQRVFEPTHRQGNILDVVLVNEPYLIDSVFVGAPLTPTCDHNIISCKLSCTVVSKNECRIPRKNFAKSNFVALRDFLRHISWSKLMYDTNSYTAESFFQIFKDCLHFAFDKFVL